MPFVCNPSNLKNRDKRNGSEYHIVEDPVCRLPERCKLRHVVKSTRGHNCRQLIGPICSIWSGEVLARRLAI